MYSGQPARPDYNSVWLQRCLFSVLLTRIGANDPEFNLRRDAALIVRRDNTKNTVFASVIEPHGSYNPVSELSINSNSNIATIEVVYDDDNYTAVSITDVKGNEQLFIVSNKNPSKTAEHKLSVNNQDYSWTGPYLYK